MEVHIEESDTKGRAFVGSSDGPQAEMTYSRAGDALLIIDHTEVDDSLRGTGAGRFLLDSVVALARERGVKILPLCPFARSQFEKDASIRDVLR
ncbi:MAG: N-acetyltransferase [Rhodothermales bacterium]|nr:N-acetyltransferase [Rhodothermales bacterium]MBO6779418.1 N-acetyltransferase [Rhodothermales bacterium]